MPPHRKVYSLLAKILIIRFSSIGDIVLASPVYRCVKQQVQDAEVHLLTKTKFKAVTEYNPYLDKIYYYDDNMSELLLQLQAEQYDTVLDLHNNFRSNTVKRSLKVPYHTIEKLSVQKFLLTKLHLNLMPKRHITTRSLLTAAPLGVKDDGKGLDYFIPQKDKVDQHDIPAAHQLGYVAIVIGATYYTKKLPVYKLIELCAALKYPIILLGGKEDIDEGHAISETNPVKIYNACGKFNLNESADLLRQSKFVISHDTGLQYIACALGKKVIAIWGATSPALQVEPYYGSIATMQSNKPLYINVNVKPWCQPCTKYGSNRCPQRHFRCMKQQDMNLIAGIAHDWLGIE